jgi:hypothetical protein
MRPVLPRPRLTHTLRALKAVHAVRGARIGVVGVRAMTFYNMEISTGTVRARLGIEVVPHDIHELTGRMTRWRVSRDGRALFAMGGTVVAQDPSGFDGYRGWPDGRSAMPWPKPATRWRR